MISAAGSCWRSSGTVVSSDGQRSTTLVPSSRGWGQMDQPVAPWTLMSTSPYVPPDACTASSARTATACCRRRSIEGAGTYRSSLQIETTRFDPTGDLVRRRTGRRDQPGDPGSHETAQLVEARPVGGNDALSDEIVAGIEPCSNHGSNRSEGVRAIFDDRNLRLGWRSALHPRPPSPVGWSAAADQEGHDLWHDANVQHADGRSSVLGSSRFGTNGPSHARGRCGTVTS